MTSIVWGLGGPPRHDDGRAVITARLLARMTPLEVEMYSGNDLARKLTHAVHWRTKGEPIDGWYPEDFVQYGLDLAVRYDAVSPAVIITWIGQQINRVRTSAERAPVFEVPEDGPGPDFVPTLLPETVVAWLYRSLSPKMAIAVRLVVEQGLTYSEAADKVRVSHQAVSQAFERLRRKA